ncbi:MAG: hypothetical protein COZ66_01005 [Candidatus Huberarchaeum crystalense]|uniref:DUF2070 domain-containing protein n=1 Tax=Huberarchaeum crystalense TaxID=2014257 RepID=A0A2H9M7C6_HUBC1|nr:DUF2070 family protein [archaeon]NCS98477.1 DUF2070 family protein [archaeon]PIV13517.1 MAG: hypothetical protein COS45_02340 [Candidatus Huberarchaeum crystalense]PIV46412.1 MAG: hypothetical protein COS22_01655 [Candidatus Huberarchaeum crystalense]PIX28150.1 MAG: hypothetical protein COZ66_01005 [Candidatus Huberarchaeum crystalense]
MADPIALTKYLDKSAPLIQKSSKQGLLFYVNLILPLIFSIIFNNVWFFVLFGISSLASTFLVRDKNLSFQQSEFINLLSNVVECGFYAIGLIFHLEFYALAIGLSLSFGIRVFFLRTLGNSIGRALVKSSIRLFIIVAIFFLFYSHPSDTNLGRKIIAMSFLFSLLVIFVIYSISEPFKVFAKVDLFELLVAFFTDWFTGSTKSEKSLLKLSKDGKAMVHVLSFDTWKDQKKGQHKATFLVPYVHPGPVGNIGSSNMPKIFHDNIENSLTFHGPCTHDLDIVKNEDVMKLVGDIKSASLEQVGEKAKAVIGDRICLLNIGGKTLAFADGNGDIDIGVGLASSDIFVDMHSSSIDSDFSVMYASSLQSLNLIEEATSLKTKLAKIEQEYIILGTSQGIVGGCDIRVAYLDVGKKMVFILFDSNNLDGRQLLQSLEKTFKCKIIACSTDNHQRNNGKYMFEVLPEHIYEISRLIKEAKAGAEYVTASYGKVERITKLLGGDGYELLPNTAIAAGFLKFVLPFVITIALIFMVLAIMLWSS